MKLSNIFLVLILITFFQLNGFSYTRIYLMSEAEIDKETLKVSDICKIEGDNIDLISAQVISSDLYSDSIVDNKELYDFLSQHIDKKILIYGSGVKIKKVIHKNEIEKSVTVLIEKGRMIDLSIKRNGIVIEMKGKALNSGYLNEEIDFRLSTGKVIKGKISSEKKAEIIL